MKGSQRLYNTQLHRESGQTSVSGASSFGPKRTAFVHSHMTELAGRQAKQGQKLDIQHEDAVGWAKEASQRSIRM